MLVGKQRIYYCKEYQFIIYCSSFNNNNNSSTKSVIVIKHLKFFVRDHSVIKAVTQAARYCGTLYFCQGRLKTDKTCPSSTTDAQFITVSVNIVFFLETFYLNVFCTVIPGFFASGREILSVFIINTYCVFSAVSV